MMRDVFLLRGHEKDISTLVWHPIHSNFLTTGGADGAMHHYLLDEQNLPDGSAATLSPYDAPENSDAPAQTIYPAHRVTYAHDFAIWSLDWHPLGHILASGSNDRATRFWSRPRPGDNTYKDDRWHIGQTAAEAQGTWKRTTDRTARDEEEEAEDEADGLVDQQMPARQNMLPGLAGLPGISAPKPAFPDGTSTGGAQPLVMPPGMGPNGLPFPGAGGPPLPGFNGQGGLPFSLPQGGAPPLPGNMDLEKIKQMFGGQLPPVPPPNGQQGFPPPPPGFTGGQGVPPPPMPFPGFPGAPPMLPPGFNHPGFPSSTPPDLQGQNRRRAPLPSQKESLQEEIKRGKYPRAR